jgi:hypothetical protein
MTFSISEGEELSNFVPLVTVTPRAKRDSQDIDH